MAEVREYISREEQLSAFRSLKTRNGNQACFDCNARNPTWASTEMDKWTAEQLKIMTVGGNDAAKNFFKEKGWTDHQSAKIDEKYTSRAAKMYRQHLSRAAGKGEAAEDDDSSAASPALANGSSAGAGSLADAPLASEFMTPAQAKALAALAAKEEAAAKDAAPITMPSPAGSAGAGGSSSSSGGGGSAASAAGARKAFGTDGRDQSGVSLDVSAIVGAAPATGSGEAASAPIRRPVIIGSSSSAGASGGGKLGASKLGAKKLGGAATGSAVRLSTGGPSSSGSGFDSFDAERSEILSQEEQLSKALAQAELSKAAAPAPAPKPAPSSSTVTSSSGGSSSSSSSGAFSKYSSAKAISSDAFFGSEDGDAQREAAHRLAALGNARAISSDQVFGNPGSPGVAGSSDGGGRYHPSGRSGSYGAGEGVSEFVEKLGAAVGEDVKRLGSEVAARTAKLREGVGAFLDVMRR